MQQLALVAPLQIPRGEIIVLREVPLHCLLRPGIQAHSGGDHHQHPRGQNSDGGQAHGVLLHAVEEARNGRHVFFIIIESFVLFQGLQHKNTPGHEQKVGADDHQYHRHEEQDKGLQGVLGGKGDVIAPAQGQQAQHQQRPLDLGLPLACIGRGEQLYRLHPGDGHAVDAVGSHIQHQEEGPGQGQTLGVYKVKAQNDLRVQQLADEQGAELVKQHPYCKPQHHGREAAEGCFVEKHPADVPLFQAQNVVNAKLTLALLHEKAVDIKQQNYRQQHHHHHADGHEHLNVLSAPQLQDALVRPECEYNVKHA